MSLASLEYRRQAREERDYDLAISLPDSGFTLWISPILTSRNVGNGSKWLASVSFAGRYLFTEYDGLLVLNEVIYRPTGGHPHRAKTPAPPPAFNWEPLDGFTEWRGFLPGDPETTLFIISTEGRGFMLTGAFLPDEEDGLDYASLEDACAAADVAMNKWIESHTYGWRVSDEDLIKEYKES